MAAYIESIKRTVATSRMSSTTASNALRSFNSSTHVERDFARKRHTCLRLCSDLSFFALRQKLVTLGAIKTYYADRVKVLDSEMEDKTMNITARDRDIAAMDDDGPGVQAEKEALESIVESARNRVAKTREDIDALILLCEAVEFGRSLLLLGKETQITHDTFDDHWVWVLSDAHRGDWEYFWSIPDGVVRAG
jgi:hypothetical protein